MFGKMVIVNNTAEINNLAAVGLFHQLYKAVGSSEFFFFIIPVTAHGVNEKISGINIFR